MNTMSGWFDQRVRKIDSGLFVIELVPKSRADRMKQWKRDRLQAMAPKANEGEQSVGH